MSESSQFPKSVKNDLHMTTSSIFPKPSKNEKLMTTSCFFTKNNQKYEKSFDIEDSKLTTPTSTKTPKPQKFKTDLLLKTTYINKKKNFSMGNNDIVDSMNERYSKLHEDLNRLEFNDR